jgi:thermitase
METMQGSSTTNEGGEYYYVQGQKIPVSRRADLIAIRPSAPAATEAVSAFAARAETALEPADEFSEIQSDNLRLYRVPAGRTEETRAAAVAPQAAIADTGGVQVHDVYTNEHGKPLILTDELIVKFKRAMSGSDIQQVLQKYGLEEIEPLTFTENAFLFRTTDASEQRALHIANELVEAGLAEYAYPSWIEHVGYRSASAMPSSPMPSVPPPPLDRGLVTDPLFPQQWHLRNTGQVAGGVAGTPGADIHATAAWDVTMGSTSIKLAVIDGGTDIAHSDLNVPGKLADPIDLTVTPPTANPVGGAHGTQVAGMAVAAANNAVVGAGSAPNCRLIAIKAGDTIPQLIMAKGFQYAADHGADVITCSLGPVGPWILTDGLRDAIDYATTYGRNGRGCVYFQAVDNAANPVSVDQVSSYERTTAVSRTNNTDTYDGAALGPELDICAPGRNVLTITNTAPGNTTTSATVTGTSFATPLTAGVGCLVLSVNPALSFQEVRQVLFDTANKIDAASMAYTPAPAGFPPGTRNDRCGYGRVNAQDAVIRAGLPSTRDLYIRDTTGDTGTVPQPTAGFWDSPDIWVRNLEDGGMTHQAPLAGHPNFVYARVWNRGADTSLPCWVRIYVASYAGVEFRYPYDFKRDTTAAAGGGTPGNLRSTAEFPAIGTYLLGTQRIGSIPSHGSATVDVQWPASLIPPTAEWHPCVLVEVSPHDGPLPTGPHTWENNNIGQKNVTVIYARASQRIVFPFRWGHALQTSPFIDLEVRRIKGPASVKTYLDLKSPTLTKTIANSIGVKLPSTGDIVPGPRPIDALPIGVPVATVPVSAVPRPGVKVTFLDPAKISIAASGAREDASPIVVSFPRGSSVELNSADAGAATVSDDTSSPADRAQQPQFSISTIDKIPVIALNPALTNAQLRVPVLKPVSVESALHVDIPANAVKGDTYIYDVAARDARQQLLGGVRLQINIL